MLMSGVGAVDALNLDGGGSSALVVDGALLNRPTGGATEREVMSAIVTVCR
jgi:exopolysaccharide biosynthesis protein